MPNPNELHLDNDDSSSSEYEFSEAYTGSDNEESSSTIIDILNNISDPEENANKYDSVKSSQNKSDSEDNSELIEVVIDNPSSLKSPSKKKKMTGMDEGAAKQNFSRLSIFTTLNENKSPTKKVQFSPKLNLQNEKISHDKEEIVSKELTLLKKPKVERVSRHTYLQDQKLKLKRTETTENLKKAYIANKDKEIRKIKSMPKDYEADQRTNEFKKELLQGINFNRELPKKVSIDHSLPPEVICHIIGFLEFEQLLIVSQLNKLWNKIVKGSKDKFTLQIQTIEGLDLTSHLYGTYEEIIKIKNGIKKLQELSGNLDQLTNTPISLPKDSCCSCKEIIYLLFSSAVATGMWFATQEVLSEFTDFKYLKLLASVSSVVSFTTLVTPFSIYSCKNKIRKNKDKKVKAIDKELFSKNLDEDIKVQKQVINEALAKMKEPEKKEEGSKILSM